MENGWQIVILRSPVELFLYVSPLFRAMKVHVCFLHDQNLVCDNVAILPGTTQLANVQWCAEKNGADHIPQLQ